MNIYQIAEQLKQNQVVAYPTESVFGLGCNPLSESAVKNLLVLKNRPIEKGLILIAPNVDFLRPFIALEKFTASDLAKLQGEYDHPITWVVPAQKTVPYFLTGQFDSIAVRICRHTSVQQLCELSGFALTSTSANLSGKPPCKTADEVRLQFGEFFPVLDESVGNALNPSEIRDLFTGQLFRQG
ncbi:MAG: Sua5/YciO/YrdC/YwlC family protein [Lonepinella koalarum]|nr:Sua5/YciO/YrdC/YwlC family protein [Lonepinella koalarum]